MDTHTIVDELMQLATEGPRVSVYLPTVRAGTEVRQNRIRFKNAVRDVQTRLDELKIDSSAARELLAPAHERLDDTEYWSQLGDGLALFLAPGFVREHGLPEAPAEITTVGTRFHLRPLLALLARETRFEVLALSHNRVQVYRATIHSMMPHEVKGLPANLEDVVGSEPDGRHLDHHASNARGQAQYHAQGAGKDDRDEELATFCRAVDRAILETHAGKPPPLVLAGVAHVVSAYRAVSHHPQLLERSVTGSPEDLDTDDLHAAARGRVELELEEARAEQFARFEAHRGDGSALVTLEDIVLAAMDGRVDTLLFAADGEFRWGRVDAGQRRVDERESPRPADEDLVDRAVSEAFASGARIVPLERARLPDDTVAAALTRF